MEKARKRDTILTLLEFFRYYFGSTNENNSFNAIQPKPQRCLNNQYIDPKAEMKSNRTPN